MSDQPISFDITPEGVLLLGQILETAMDSVLPDWDEGTPIPEELQETVVQVAGAVLVEILRQVEETEVEN